MKHVLLRYRGCERLKSGNHLIVTYQLTVAVMVKSILYTVDEHTSFHHPTDIIRSDAQIAFWQTQFLKRDNKKLGRVIASENAITGKLSNFHSNRIRGELDKFSIDVVSVFPVLYDKMVGRDSKTPILLVLRGIFKQGVHKGEIGSEIFCETSIAAGWKK